MERPGENLSKERKVLITTFLILCNSVLVSLNSCRFVKVIWVFVNKAEVERVERERKEELGV
jgi:hypothetical protein